MFCWPAYPQALHLRHFGSDDLGCPPFSTVQTIKYMSIQSRFSKHHQLRHVTSRWVFVGLFKSLVPVLRRRTPRFRDDSCEFSSTREAWRVPSRSGSQSTNDEVGRPTPRVDSLRPVRSSVVGGKERKDVLDACSHSRVLGTWFSFQQNMCFWLILKKVI